MPAKKKTTETPKVNSAPASQPVTQRLYRSRTDNVIAGVAGGIAEYLQVDPSIIRLIFVVLTLAGGSGVLLYIVAWLILPENPDQTPVAATAVAEPRDPGRGRAVAGVVLLGIGAMALVQNLWGFYGWDKLWPVILIAIGLVFLVGRK